MKVDRQYVIDQLYVKAVELLPGYELTKTEQGIDIKNDTKTIQMCVDTLIQLVETEQVDMQKEIEHRIMCVKESIDIRSGDSKFMLDNVLFRAVSESMVKERNLVSNPLINDIKLSFVINLDKSVVFVNDCVFKDIGITIDELIDKAHKNSLTIPLDIQTHEITPYQFHKAIMLTADNGCDTSTLLCMPTRLAGYTGYKRMIALMPSREFIVCVEQNDSIDEMQDIRCTLFLKTYYKAIKHRIVYPLSDTPFIINPDGSLERIIPRKIILKETGGKNVSGKMIAGVMDKDGNIEATYDIDIDSDN